MKNQITTFIVVCTLLLTLNGCSEREGAATTPSQTSGDNAADVIQKATATAEAQTEVVKAKSVDAPANVPAQSEAAAAQIEAAAVAAKAQVDAQTSQAQGLIDQAGKLLGENKWSEALALLNQVSGKSLTPEQQSLVQSLTGQVQKAGETAAKTRAVDEATKSVGGLSPTK